MLLRSCNYQLNNTLKASSKAFDMCQTKCSNNDSNRRKTFAEC